MQQPWDRKGDGRMRYIIDEDGTIRTVEETTPDPPRLPLSTVPAMTYSWWEESEGYWVVTVLLSLLIALPVAIFLAPPFFEWVKSWHMWSGHKWVDDVLCAIAPYAVAIGGVAGSIVFGLLWASGKPYEPVDYGFSALCVLGGMLALPIALYLLALILTILIYVIIVAVVIAVIGAIIAGS